MPLLSDITAVHDFLAAHRASQGDGAYVKCMAVQARNIVQKVRTLGVELEDGAGLLQLVNSGPWSNPHKDTIVQAITDSINTSTACSHVHTKNQKWRALTLI